MLDIPPGQHIQAESERIPNDDVRNGCQGEQMMDRVNVFQGVEWTSRVSFGGIKKYPFSFAALVVVPSSIHPAFLASTSGRVLAVKLKVSNICPNTQHTTKPPSGTFCRFMLWTTDYCAGLPVCMFCALCGGPATIINVRVGFWTQNGFNLFIYFNYIFARNKLLSSSSLSVSVVRAASS